MEPVVRITRYIVSCFPEDDEDASTWDIIVEERSAGRWSVATLFQVYDIDGEPTYEPSPSNRDDDFKAKYRFDLVTALALAARVAPTVVVNGMTPEQVIAWRERVRAADGV